VEEGEIKGITSMGSSSIITTRGREDPGREIAKVPALPFNEEEREEGG